MLLAGRISQTRKAFTRIARLGPESAPGLVGSFSLTAVTGVAVLLINLGGGIAQARGLGPEHRGDLTVAMLWPTLIASVGSLGVRDALIFQTARGPSRSPELATALAVAAGQTVLLVLLGWQLLPLVLYGKPSLLLQQTTFYLWFLPLYPLTYYPIAHLQGKLGMRAYNSCSLCISAVSTGILIGLWLSGRMTIHSALTASLVSYVATAALAIGFILARGDWSWRPKWQRVGPLFSYGIRMQLGSIAVLAGQLRVDLLVLSLLVAPALIGTYTVATSAALVASLLPNAASYVLLPAFARQSRSTLPTTLAQVLFAAGLLTLLTGPLLVGLLPLVVPIFFGSAFAGAVPLTALLALGFLIRGWNVMLASVIQGSGKPFRASIGQALEFGVLVVLLVILAPRFHAEGAACSVIAAASVSLCCLLVLALAGARLSLGDLGRVWVAEFRRYRGWAIVYTHHGSPD